MLMIQRFSLLLMRRRRLRVDQSLAVSEIVLFFASHAIQLWSRGSGGWFLRWARVVGRQGL